MIDCLFYSKLKLFYNELHVNNENGVKIADLQVALETDWERQS